MAFLNKEADLTATLATADCSRQIESSHVQAGYYYELLYILRC